jgi:hypothetical protein
MICLEEVSDHPYDIPRLLSMTTVQDLCKTLQRISWADLSDSDDETENIPKTSSAPKSASWADLSDSEDEGDFTPPKLVRSLAKPTVDPPVILLPSPSLSPVPSDSSEEMALKKDDKDEKEAARQAEIQQKTVKGIRTLIARNLPRDITVHQLRDKFEGFGIIQDIYIPRNMDRSSPYFGTVKGFALVKFLRPEEALRAFQSLYRRLRLGTNCIYLEFAKEDRERS